MEHRSGVKSLMEPKFMVTVPKSWEEHSKYAKNGLQTANFDICGCLLPVT